MRIIPFSEFTEKILHYRIDLPQSDDVVKKGKEAVESCNKAIKLKPNDAMAYFYTGTIYIQIGSKLENNSNVLAVEFLTKAIELKPANTEIHSLAYNNRGYIYSLNGKYDKAVEDFKKALGIMPDNTLAKNNLEKNQKLADAEEKIKTLSEALKEKPEAHENYYEMAQVYADIEKYEKVIERLDKYIEGNKTNYKAYKFRGWTKWKLNDKSGAYEDYNKAIELEPNNADNYYWRSATQEKREARTADLKKAIELKPDYADALWELGWILYNPMPKLLQTEDDKKFKIEHLKEAIDIFIALSRVNPNYDVRVYRFLANLYMELNPPNCDESIVNRKKAVEMFNEDSEYLAETYTKCNKYEDAINVYREILNELTLDETKYEYIVKLAKTYMMKNDIKFNRYNDTISDNSKKNEIVEAKNLLQEAIKLVPQCEWEKLTDKDRNGGNYKLVSACMNRREAYAYLGLIYEGLGESEKAIENFTAGIKSFPDASLNTHRAILYYYDKKDYGHALEDCNYSVKNSSPLNLLGNIFCNESFISKIKDKIAKQKEDKQRYAKYKKYIDLYKSTMPPEMKNCSWNFHKVNEVTKLSISDALYIVYQKGLGITEVKLPNSISQELSAMAKQRGLKISMDIDLPFYVWFVDNVMGESLDQSASGLCYFSALLRKSQFDVIQTFINGYLDGLKKKA